MDVGYCCAHMYVQHINFEVGGETAMEGAEDPPLPLVLCRKKPCLIMLCEPQNSR